MDLNPLVIGWAIFFKSADVSMSEEVSLKQKIGCITAAIAIGLVGGYATHAIKHANDPEEGNRPVKRAADDIESKLKMFTDPENRQRIVDAVTDQAARKPDIIDGLESEDPKQREAAMQGLKFMLERSAEKMQGNHRER